MRGRQLTFLRSFFALLALATVNAGGCARETQMVKWEADFYYTEQLYVDGQYQLAVERYRALRKSAKFEQDADEAALMDCEVQARAKDYGAAATCYDVLATMAFDPQVRVRGLLHAGELRYYELDKKVQALKLFSQTIDRFPNATASLRVLDHLYLHAKNAPNDRSGMLTLFERLEKANPLSEIADNLLLRSAMLLELDNTKTSLARAVQLLEKHDKLHRDEATLLDALMTRARCLKELARFKEEAEVLEQVVATYETSYIFASYAGEDHKVATRRLIDLYRKGPLKNLERAEAHARHLPAMLHHPLDLPQMMIVIAEIQEERGDNGGAIATCRGLMATVKARQKRMIQEDQRICSESGSAQEQANCRSEIDKFVPIDPRQVAEAEAMIARLQAKTQVKTGSSR